jgi:hypothetical protein
MVINLLQHIAGRLTAGNFYVQNSMGNWVSQRHRATATVTARSNMASAEIIGGLAGRDLISG